MPPWNPNQYLKFAEERTQPCRDLAARIQVSDPRRVIDLGCGPGNSTAVLRERWPDAEFTGLDSSAEMIARARHECPAHRWIAGDISAWAAAAGDGLFDVVFSNAALQWVEDHARVYPRLLEHVAPGGALAIQIPGNIDALPHRLMREVAASPDWSARFAHGKVREWHHHEMEFYYDALAARASRLDIWATEYLHILPDARSIVEWYRGTGLRPFLEALESEADRERFAADYLERLRPHFQQRPAGGILFPFRRLFLIAYRG
ncbi:MAG TPA: methyltransferase domain-containing protein [Bryobacteraceae bacterium]|nr:methyltransferase domain-containing protein [Bryobacteraceae bacterium]